MDCIKFYKGNDRFKNIFIENIKILNKYNIYIDDDYYNASKKTFFILNNDRIYTSLTSMLHIVDNMNNAMNIIKKKRICISKFLYKR